MTMCAGDLLVKLLQKTVKSTVTKITITLDDFEYIVGLDMALKYGYQQRISEIVYGWDM